MPVDGEMQADSAVVEELLEQRRPGGSLSRTANVLVFPNLTAANASYKLLNRLAGAEVPQARADGLRRQPTGLRLRRVADVSPER